MEDTIDDKLKQAEKMLDEFEEIHNLNRVVIPNEIEDILNLSHAQLEKLQGMDCAVYSFQLSQFAYYIQRTYNKESSTLKWINNQIDNFVASHWSDFDSYTKYEMRPRLIARENEVLAKLLRQASFYEQKMERMSFLGSSISNMAEKMKSLQMAKSYQTKTG
jgi:hypothetical protein